MKITSIESFVLSNKLEESFYFSQWEYSERRICIVKITCDNGYVGWGEGYGPADVIKSGVDHLGQFIIGANILEIETIWSTLYRRSLDYARRGVLVASISAIDVALWDLKGKILDLPVYVLLGGKKREYIIPYATGLYFKESSNLEAELIKEAKNYVLQGFKAIKMKVGLGVKEDVALVGAIRKAIGGDVDLMIDANHAYNLREAILLCRKLEAYDIYWFEEPLSPEYYKQYAELRSKTSIPIAGGECEYLRYGFNTLLQSNAVDIVQPDICAAGGLTESKKIATLASLSGIELIPHTWGTGIAIAAAAHFIFNLDILPGRLSEQCAYMEYDRTENALRDDLIYSNLRFLNGKLTISDAPGLGFELNEDVLYKYAVSHNPVELNAI